MDDTGLETLICERFGEAPEVPESLKKNIGLCRMAGRGSCRSFLPGAPDKAVLKTLAAVALAAPSKSDLQQRDILLVQDAHKTAQLKDLLKAQEWIAGAPAFVVFLADNRRQRQIQDWHAQPFPNDHLDAFFNASLDAGIALNAFMTAAEATGLGCCPISTIRNHMSEVRDLFGLPDHVFAVAAMAVGHPAERPRISPRLSLETTVHSDVYRDTNWPDVAEYDARRRGNSDAPAWSEAKAQMYSKTQRTGFGDFIRRIGFRTD